MGGGGGVGVVVVPMSSSSQRSDPQRPKRRSATARTTVLRRWASSLRISRIDFGSVTVLLLSWCFTSTETTRLIRDCNDCAD